jgi:hypothetical protein
MVCQSTLTAYVHYATSLPTISKNCANKPLTYWNTYWADCWESSVHVCYCYWCFYRASHGEWLRKGDWLKESIDCYDVDQKGFFFIYQYDFNLIVWCDVDLC